MKLPVTMETLGKHAGAALGATQNIASAIGTMAATAFRRLRVSGNRPRNVQATGRTAALIGIISCLAILVMLLITMAMRVPHQAANSSVATKESAGRDIASSLLIPGEGAWPWPLALEPRSRYTDADAAVIRPDLGMIDVSSLTSRRKAQLESILDAVD